MNQILLIIYTFYQFKVFLGVSFLYSPITRLIGFEKSSCYSSTLRKRKCSEKLLMSLIMSLVLKPIKKEEQHM